jgi:hypothetical protein
MLNPFKQGGQISGNSLLLGENIWYKNAIAYSPGVEVLKDYCWFRTTAMFKPSALL